MQGHVRMHKTMVEWLLTTAIVDAKISFPSGLTIAWQDKPLGSIKMDDLDVIGDVGATIDLSSLFSVADVGHLTEFTKVDLPP